MKRINKKLDSSIKDINKQIESLQEQMQAMNKQLIHLQEIKQNLLIVQEEMEGLNND